jgi:glycosyltransferase involved in cell wall biosynthesis
MKIGVFHNLPPGGAKRVLFNQVKDISKRHELVLFEYKQTDEDFLDIRPFFNKINKYAFSFYQQQNRVVRDYKNFLQLKYLNKSIAEDIKKSGVDVCLIHPDKYTQSPFILSYLDNISLYYCHELLRIAYEKELIFDEKVNLIKKKYEYLTRKLRKNIDKTNAQSANTILTNSAYIKDKVKKQYGKNSVVCHPGVDLNLFSAMSGKKNKLLFLGNNKKIDGYNLVKEAIGLTKKIVEVEFKELIFSKKFSDEKLIREYSESMAVICTSYNEPFGLSPIESMACETPVLAVNDGGYRETVVDGVTGYLLPRDARVFAEKIRYLIENPDVVKKMGKAGREHVKKNFTWEKHNKCLEKYLYKVAGIK